MVDAGTAKQQAVAAKIAAQGVAKLGQAGYTAAVQANISKAQAAGVKVSAEQVSAAMSRASSPAAATVGSPSAAATVKPASGGGVTVSSSGSSSGNTVITSGPYAGMTEYQRQQAVAAKIAAQGVARYGQQGYSDKVAQNVVRDMDTGFLDPNKANDAATIANIFNRAGVPQDVAVASIQKAVASRQPPVPVAPLTDQPPAPEIPFVNPIPNVNLPAIGDGDKQQPEGGNVTDDANTLAAWWDNSGIPAPQPPSTKPAPGTPIVGGGLVYVLGIALIIGVIVALVKKLRKSKKR